MSVAEPLSRPPDGNYGSAIARCLGINRKHKGTGFRVEKDYILTCAHVVKQCLNISKKTDEVLTAEVTGKTMEIVFLADPTKSFVAVEVVPELWRFGGEDIAVLKLSRAVPDAVAVISLKQGQEFWHHKFQLFGFPEDRWDGRWATGEILGAQPETGRVQLEGTKNQGLGIQEGFSGSPVWDENLGGVVGMTVARDEDEPTKIGFMIPYEKLKTVFDAITLFSLLLPEEAKLSPHWKNAYQLVETSNIHETTPKTLQEAIIKVLDMTDRNGYRAIAQFVGYFALQSLGLNIPSIRDWLAIQKVNVGELLQDIGQRLPQESQQKGSPHLLFCVETDHNSDRFNIRAYLVKDTNIPKEQIPLKSHEEALLKAADNKVNFSEIENILRQSLNEIVELVEVENGLADIQVEIFLPLGKLEMQEVDLWTADEKSIYTPNPQPVACRYRMVLRCSERLNHQICTPQMKVLWRTKWKTIEQYQGQPHCKGFVCDRDENGKYKSIEDVYDALNQDDVIGIKLTRKPQPHSDDNPLPLLLGTGVSIAILPRQDIVDEKNYEELLKVCLSELPSYVKEKRKSAWQYRSPSHPKHIESRIGEQIGLVWENPYLVPLTSSRNRSQLKMPS